MLNKLATLKQRFSSNKSKIISNVAWLLVDRALCTGVSFLISIWLAHYLGPEQFGTLRYVIAFVFLFSPIATLGMTSVVTKDLVEHPSLKNEILGTACVLRLIFGFSSAALSIISILFFAPKEPFIWLMIAITSSTYLFQPLMALEQWFESQVDSKQIVLARNLTLLIITILKIALITYKAPLIAFVYLLVLEAVIYGFTLLLAYRLKNKDIHQWVIKLSRAKILIKESWPLLLTGIAATLYLKIDQVMLGQMADKKSVGVYAVAATLSEIWFVIPMAFTSSLFPSIIKSKKLSKEEYEKRLQQFYDLMALLSYIILIFFLPISNYVIITAYGAEYAPAVNILYIYILNCIFSFQGFAQGAWIISEGLQKLNFYAAASGAAINITLNLVLIPHFQGLGAAIATLISYAFACYFAYWFFPETRGSAMLMTKAILLPFRLPSYLKNIKQNL